MNNEPYITIGIASYNYGKYLKRAFEAIKRQGFKDFEILYSDDNSSDDSVEIIKGFIKNDPQINIRLIESKENLGVMGNKNRILENARGKYILICDADDWMEDNCLQVLAEAAKKTNADQIVAVTQNVTDDKVIQIQKIPHNQSKWTWGMNHGTLYKRGIIEKYNLRLDKNAYPDDIYLNMIFHEKSGDTVFLNDIVYNWYKHSDSESNKNNKGKKNLWVGYNALKSGLTYMSSIYKRQDKENAEQIEYMAIKYYCLLVLHRSVNMEFKEYYGEYKELFELMNKVFKNYMKNEYSCSVNGKGIVRFPTAVAVFIIILCEKLHLIKVLLWSYWAFSNILNINKYVD